MRSRRLKSFLSLWKVLLIALCGYAVTHATAPQGASERLEYLIEAEIDAEQIKELRATYSLVNRTIRTSVIETVGFQTVTNVEETYTSSNAAIVITTYADPVYRTAQVVRVFLDFERSKRDNNAILAPLAEKYATPEAAKKTQEFGPFRDLSDANTRMLEWDAYFTFHFKCRYTGSHLSSLEWVCWHPQQEHPKQTTPYVGCD